MKTVILCGGKGLRYRNSKPKGLAQIGEKPVLHHVMEIYSRQGYDDFILILGFGHEAIEKYFRDIEHNYNINFLHVSENMNKGGALYLAEKLINDNNFFCTYCDGLANIKLEELLNIHINCDNIATITTVKPQHEFGIVIFGDNNKIIEFREKPIMDEWTNGGFFVFTKEIFDHIYYPEDNLETDIFDRLVKKQKIGGYKHTGFWNTINTQKDEENLNKLCRNGRLEWHNI